jgi:hypothetical protein
MVLGISAAPDFLVKTFVNACLIAFPNSTNCSRWMSCSAAMDPKPSKVRSGTRSCPLPVLSRSITEPSYVMIVIVVLRFTPKGLSHHNIHIIKAHTTNAIVESSVHRMPSGCHPGGPRMGYPRTDAFHRLSGWYPRISVPK